MTLIAASLLHLVRVHRELPRSRLYLCRVRFFCFGAAPTATSVPATVFDDAISSRLPKRINQTRERKTKTKKRTKQNDERRGPEANKKKTTEITRICLGVKKRPLPSVHFSWVFIRRATEKREREREKPDRWVRFHRPGGSARRYFCVKWPGPFGKGLDISLSVVFVLVALFLSSFSFVLFFFLLLLLRRIFLFDGGKKGWRRGDRSPSQAPPER